MGRKARLNSVLYMRETESVSFLPSRYSKRKFESLPRAHVLVVAGMFELEG